MSLNIKVTTPIALIVTLLLTGCPLQQTARPDLGQATPTANAEPAADATASATQEAVQNPQLDRAVEQLGGDGGDAAEQAGSGPDTAAASDSDVASDAVVDPGPADLWDRVRSGFALPGHDNHQLDAHIAWLENHPGYMKRVSERARPYLYLIVDEVQKRNMPTEIALLPVVESAFQPFAYSFGSAAGLWQFVPATGKRFGLRQNWWYDGRRDVAESTRAALDYLEYLHRMFDGDWLLALASYNSGEGTVLNAVRKNKRHGKPTDFWHLDLPDETRGYVPRLLAIADIVENPAAHNLSLDTIPDTPYLAQVKIGSQIDLDLAAELAGLPLDELYRYNPAYNRWATDPDGDHVLLIPAENAEQMRAGLATLPASKRVKWRRHTIRSGENLQTIARHYHTAVDLLRSVNGIHGHFIRAGDTLIIPVARTQLSRYSLSAEQRLRSTQERQRKGDKMSHTVRQGDTLWDIAQEYGVGVRELARWNGMAPRDPLKIGKKLVIWAEPDTTPQRHAGAKLPVNFKHPQLASTRQRVGYTVRSGDSLARISQRFRVSVTDLRRWNDLEGQKYLHPGQKLKLYVDVTRMSM